MISRTMINQAVKNYKRLQTWPIQPKFLWSLIKLRWKSCNRRRDQESPSRDRRPWHKRVQYFIYRLRRCEASFKLGRIIFCGLLGQDKWDTIVSKDPHCLQIQGYNLSMEEVCLFSIHGVGTQDYHSWVSGFGKFSYPLPRFRPHRKSCLALNVSCLNAHRPKA